MTDPPSSSDPPSVDAPSSVVSATSTDEEREDGDTVEAAAPRHTRGSGETTEAFQSETLELQSVTETQECDFGLERAKLPDSPSMKSEKLEDKEDDWDLKEMASEETMKATGNARRTRPHKGIFVRKGKKKNSEDDEDGKVIKSLFSEDSSVAQINALFDQESCFNGDEDEDGCDDDDSEEQPRKADPPDSSPIELTRSDSVEEAAAVSNAEEEKKEKSDIKELEVPWDKKGTSLGHVEKLVASIKAKKSQKKAQPLTEKTECTSTKEATNSGPPKQREANKKKSEDTSTKEVAGSNPPKQGEIMEKKIEDSATKEATELDHHTQKVNEKREDTSAKQTSDSDSPKQVETNKKSEEYEDFVGDFLQSGSGDDTPQPVETEAETTMEVAEGAIGEAENDNFIVDEVEKSESQNAFLEQFEALGIEEESPREKQAAEEKEADDTLNKSLDAISEWRKNEEDIQTDNEGSKGKARQEDETSPDHESLTEKDGELNENEVRNIVEEQDKIDMANTNEKKRSPAGETTNRQQVKAEVETVLSTEDLVVPNDGEAKEETTDQSETQMVPMTVSTIEYDTASSNVEENDTMKEREESDVPKEETPEEPVHIFKFSKGISEDDWQERNEMASDWQFGSPSMHLDGVAAAENIHRFTNQLNKEPEPRPWKVSYKQRTRNHPGFKNIDIYSVLESTKVTVSEKARDDYIPWEHRDVKQLFLQERSVEFSRNWYGENQYTRVNYRFKLPVCRPRSMEMPIGTAEDAVEWNKDIYTTWKSPYQKIEHQRLKLNKSEDDEGKSNDGESKEKDDEVEKQSHLVEKKSASGDDDEEGSQDSEYDGEGSYSDGSYSDGSYSDSEGSYDDEEDSFHGSVVSETGSAIIVDDNGTVAGSWEEAPECGDIVNMKLKIGEHVTRVHPAYTSSLRRSRWRKKYFPKGSFPY